MPKNAQGSWVGTTARPTFKTYQTAGQLQPAAPPAAAPSTPPPAPIVPPGPVQLPPGFDFGGGVAQLPPEFDFGGGAGQFQPVPYEFAQPAAVIDDDPRARLAQALLGSGKGGVRSRGGSTPGKF